MNSYQIYQQRWEALKKLEDGFLADPDDEHQGIILNDLWEEWLLEGYAISNRSGAIAGPRVDLFNSYIAGRKLEEDVVDYLRAHPLPEFKGKLNYQTQ